MFFPERASSVPKIFGNIGLEPKNMSKQMKKGKWKRDLMAAINRLPPKIEDKKHGLTIVFANNQSRSNETRFEHFAKTSHHLTARDINYLCKGILGDAALRKDPSRKRVFNYFFKRLGSNTQYIQVSILIDKKNPHLACVRTLFVVSHVKWLKRTKK